MWDLPRPGLEPVSPALAGRFSTTAPPGKPLDNSLLKYFAAEKSYEKVPQIFVSRCLFPEHRGAIGHVLEGPDGFPVEVAFSRGLEIEWQ